MKQARHMNRREFLIYAVTAMGAAPFFLSACAAGSTPTRTMAARPSPANAPKVATAAAPVAVPASQASKYTADVGPLKVSKINPRYLTNSSGKAILLAGSDYWNLWQDGGRTNPPPPFDYEAFLSFAIAHGYNYLKSQTWEHARHITDGKYWYIRPTIWARTGPDNALDGELKFDLKTLNEEYFSRVRQRVVQAGKLGLYAIVDFFHGFSVADKGNISDAWTAHPFNASNNINGINGDPEGTGDGRATQTLAIPAVTDYQEAYVAHMIDTLNDLDNVIWEICLEPDGNYIYGTSTGRDLPGRAINKIDHLLCGKVANCNTEQAWYAHFIDYVHAYEKGKAKQHPVLYSVEWPGGDNGVLLASAAECISPNEGGGYDTDPPASDGTKVILANTDHIMWPNGNADWAWRTFTRGMGGIFHMDGAYSNYDDQLDAPYQDYENFRDNLGWILGYAQKMDLIAMAPQNRGTKPCSTGYCLRKTGEYICYQPDSGGPAFQLDLRRDAGTFAVEWFRLSDGTIQSGATIDGNANCTLAPPWEEPSVAYLRAR